MRKKYNTIEELRGALAERQKRWRERNRGYERVRAKAKYAKRGGSGDGASVEGEAEEGERDPEGDGGGSAVKGVVHGGGNRVGNAGVGVKTVGETYYGAEPKVDAPYEEAIIKTTAPWRVGSMEPKAEVVSERELKAVEDLAIVARRKKKEVEVEWE